MTDDLPPGRVAGATQSRRRTETGPRKRSDERKTESCR
nr:MAG TPA: hypothetical protein [Caudoviricetes sp.]